MTNSFSQSTRLGQVDLATNPNIKSAVVASGGAAVVSGDWVKLLSTSKKILTVEKCTANTDEALGVVIFNPKDVNREGDEAIEVACAGSVIYLAAATTVNSGARVSIDVTRTGGINSTLRARKIVGYALDQASAVGDLVRVELNTPSFQVGA